MIALIVLYCIIIGIILVIVAAGLYFVTGIVLSTIVFYCREKSLPETSPSEEEAAEYIDL